ncbi:hypothetical protein ACJBRL_10125, partial [Streptococcus suis]
FTFFSLSNVFVNFCCLDINQKKYETNPPKISGFWKGDLPSKKNKKKVKSDSTHTGCLRLNEREFMKERLP